ncbi:MAG TPA: PilZ domain-containing protein, partial [Polyangiaceae bacterium]|nr:PilZ domain-containing protein [Polyangiaceae bacterium]
MERRNQNVERVELTTLVDICIQGDEGTPFQAESANVSGRGMQVRTSYLPEIGDELVCRFEHASREILVEGRVAWRAEGEDSGEFGIQFTALDASSAEVLRNLRAQRAVASPSPVASRLFSLDNEPEDDAWLNSGDKVRLHIEGLAAPMKASVHDGGERKVRVGSSLEFLKVGRALEIEDLRGGRTRGAQVDSVNVVLNPSTSVPELVVMLRYEGASPTPPPAHARTTSARAAAPSAEPEQDDDWSDVDEDETFEEAPSLLPERFRPAAEALKVRLGEVFGSVKSVAGQAGGVMGRSFGQASAGMKRLSARKPARRSTSAAPRSSAPRRTTAPPAHRRSSLADAGVVSRDRVDSRASLRPQAASIPAEAPLGSAERTRRLAAIGALAVVILGGSAALLRSRGEGDVPALAATTTNTAGTSPGAPGAAAPTAGAPGTVAAVPAANSAVASAPGAVVAEVPLFGPRALSTSETASAPASDMSDAQ